MAQVHQVVKGWLHTQRNWLQQAAELLLNKGEFDDNDITAIVKFLKTSEGQSITTNRAFTELMAAAPQTAEVRLKSIGNISGIENLEPRSPLDFGAGNLCIIYGNNGSGKSGYTRLVKKLTGKPGAKELKSNVFKSTPTERKCRIGFSINEVTQEVEWQPTDQAIDVLRVVDIFDTDVAINYLSKENEATYTPPVVSLFDKLASAVNKVKVSLQTQQSALVKTLPTLPPQYIQTNSGGQYNGLRANSVDSEIQKITTWTEAEEQELTQLNERLGATDPTALARQKRATATQIEQIAKQIKETASSYSKDALAVIRSYRTDAKTKRRIAQEAAQVTSAKLDGIGSDTWKALWEAARNYSQTPYPLREFPVVVDARCVLCNQELTDDTKQRLQDFEKFVQGDVEKSAAGAERVYSTALEQLPVALTKRIVTERCQAAGLTEEVILEGVMAYWQNLAMSREAMQVAEIVGTAIEVSAPNGIAATLELKANILNEQAKQHEQDAAWFNRAEAMQNKAELEASRWTSQQSKAITTEMNRLKAVAEYDKWLKLTNTTSITLMGDKVAEAAITDAYVARFNNELGSLKAKNIKVKLVKTEAKKGKVYHGLQLLDAVDQNVKLDQVLSEGERRIISLAAFLADVADKPHASTFIFDDPISSLDQDFELAVAARLVQLAKTRQVLVFTHRLSLYVALENEAKKMGEDWKDKHHTQKWIETYSGISGQTAEESARNANTTKANNILITKLGDAKRKGDQEGSSAYKDMASGLCSEIRILLERTVENDLLNSIVLRNRISVTTDNKLPWLTKIEPEDCHLIDELMTKYSTLVHSQSAENPVEIPAEPELKKDLEALKSWREEFKSRKVKGVSNL